MPEGAQDGAAFAQVIEGDLFTYHEKLAAASFDVVVSNPPYLTAAEMQDLQPETAREPAMALAAGEDGLVFYRALAKDYLRVVKPCGFLVLEIGWQQAQAVRALLKESGWGQVWCVKDYAGNDRCLIAQRAE